MKYSKVLSNFADNILDCVQANQNAEEMLEQIKRRIKLLLDDQVGCYSLQLK